MRTSTRHIRSVAVLLFIILLCLDIYPVYSQQQFRSSLHIVTTPLPDSGISLIDGDFQNNLLLAQQAIRRVDSVSRTSAAASHFAWIYKHVMQNVEAQMRGKDSSAAAFIRQFEIAFARYFLRACEEDRDRVIRPASEWYTLFSNPGAHSLALTIMGISAHTNGDMWQTLVSNFPENTIRQHKKVFLACQASIVKVYNPFFDSIAAQSWYLNLMKKLSLGLVRNVGERIIYKWRLRQVNLALLYYHDHNRFLKRLAVIQRKKEQIDRLLLHRISIILPKKERGAQHVIKNDTTKN